MPSLNKDLPWQATLQQLKLPVVSGSLPTTTTCPFCQTSMLYVLADRLYGGYRYACGHCSRHGDLLQLASRVWQLSLTATVAELERHGLLHHATRAKITQYETLINRRKQATEFWSAAQQRHRHDNPTASGLVQQLNLRSGLSGSRYDDGPAKLWGVSDKAEAEGFLGKLCGQKSRRLLSGKDWGPLVVIPFQDLPGRLCGFLFGGRQFRPEDFIYASVLANVEPGCESEAGVALHPGAVAASKNYDDAVVAVDDPLAWLSLQHKQFEQSRTPLPLALWRRQDSQQKVTHETQHGWGRFFQQRMVFWNRQFSPASLAQAIRCHAELHLGDLDKLPSGGLRTVIGRALPWSQVFEKFVNEHNDTAVRELLLQTRRHGVDASVTYRVCAPAVRDRVEQVLDELNSVRSVNFRQYEIQERDDCWYIINDKGHGQQLLCDAVLRLDQLVMSESTEPMYRGRVIYRNETLPFCERQSVLDEKPAQWIWHFLARTKRGLFRCNPTYNRHLIFIASQFHAPELVAAPGPVGWHDQPPQLVLPHFSVAPGEQPKVLDAPLFGDEAPGLKLTLPLSELDNNDVSAAIRQPGAVTLWAAIAMLLRNVMAPAYRQTPTRLGWIGPKAADGGAHAADVLDCGQIAARPVDKYRVTRLAALHNWPVKITLPPSKPGQRQIYEEVATGYYPPGTMLSLPETPAKLARLLGGWTLLEASQGSQLSEVQRVACRRLVVAFLIDWASQRFIPGGEAPTAQQTLALLEEFLTRLRLPAEELQKSRPLIYDYNEQDAADAFGQLLRVAVNERRLRQEQDGYYRETPEILISREGLLIDSYACLKQVGNAPEHLLDPARVAQLLTSCGVLLDDRGDHWLLDKNWWSELYRRRPV